MSAIWHDSGIPSFLAPPPRFSFHDLPEVVQEAPASYQAVLAEMRARDRVLGAGWLQHNAVLAHEFYQMKRDWWVSL